VKITIFIPLIALLASSQAARAQAPIAKSATQPVETFTLANGLSVAFMRLEHAPALAVQVWYRAGSKDEPKDRRGSAHMFEHMMFRGSQKVRPEDHATFLGSVGGIVNAQTEEDATHFINTVPVGYLDFTLQLEADRMRGLLFRDDVVKTEREIVKEEIRQSLNVPITRGFWRFLSIAFSKHPYAWTAAGTIADLDATSPTDLKKFYDAYYQPNNALIVVVGNTTLDQVKAAVTKQFGSIPAGATPPRPSLTSQEPVQTAARRQVVEASQLGLVLTGYKIPPARHPDIYALQIASLILGGGESSRLRVAIKKPVPALQRTLGIDAGVQAQIREEPGLWVMLAAFLNADDTAALEAMMMKHVAQLAGPNPATSTELRQAKNQIQSSLVFSLENSTGMAEQIGRSWILTEDPKAFLRDVDALEKVTAVDVQRVIKQYLTPERATTLIIPPQGAALTPVPAASGKEGAK
jgi:zinc protease